MAKKQEEETKAVAVIPSVISGNVVPTDLGDDWIQDSGAGFSKEAADRSVPILGIVQENSGEVKKKGAKYIEGVEPGNLIIRTLGKVFVVDSDESALIFQPCAFMHVWIEWQGEPGDGVPVGRFMFNDPPKDAREVADPQDPKRKLWMRENGNRLVDTREHYGHLILPEGIMPVLIPMAGTNHKVSRDWTFLAQTFVLPSPQGPKPAPGWFRAYGLTTKYAQHAVVVQVPRQGLGLDQRRRSA
jgi:hypothetical protein